MVLTVTCIVAKPGNAFLTLPAWSALGQIVISTSCPLNQKHKAAYVQATLMYGAGNDSDQAILYVCLTHAFVIEVPAVLFSFVLLLIFTSGFCFLPLPSPLLFTIASVLCYYL